MTTPPSDPNDHSDDKGAADKRLAPKTKNPLGRVRRDGTGAPTKFILRCAVAKSDGVHLRALDLARASEARARTYPFRPWPRPLFPCLP